MTQLTLLILGMLTLWIKPKYYSETTDHHSNLIITNDARHDNPECKPVDNETDRFRPIVRVHTVDALCYLYAAKRGIKPSVKVRPK